MDVAAREVGGDGQGQRFLKGRVERIGGQQGGPRSGNRRHGPTPSTLAALASARMLKPEGTGERAFGFKPARFAHLDRETPLR